MPILTLEEWNMLLLLIAIGTFMGICAYNIFLTCLKFIISLFKFG